MSAEYICQVVLRVMTDVKKDSWQERLRQDPWQALIRLVKTLFCSSVQKDIYYKKNASMFSCGLKMGLLVSDGDDVI